MSSRVLVTGGAGYIGSHACAALAAAGYVPVTFDNLSRGHRDLVQFGPFEEGDILDAERIYSVMEKWRPVGVIHFAALSFVGESVADPETYYRNNSAGALNVLSAMRRAGVNNLVFSSTCATYGLPEGDRLSEDHRQHPINPYGWSKLMVERMLWDFSEAYGLRAAALRYFNACGAHPDHDIGERHEPETHLMPRAVEAALGGGSLEIYGSDYPTPDGGAVRDYIHVCDLADAHVQALEYLRKGGATTALNLGTGRGYSVFEIAAAVRRVTGAELPATVMDRRAGDPPSLVADASRAGEVLGFSPKWLDLDAIIRSAVDWHRREAARCGCAARADGLNT